MKLQVNRLFQVTVMHRVQRQLQLLVLVAVVVGRDHTRLETVPRTWLVWSVSSVERQVISVVTVWARVITKRMIRNLRRVVESKDRRENLVQIPRRSPRPKLKARGKARGRCMNLERVRRNRKRVMKRLGNGKLKRRLLVQAYKWLFWVLSVPLDSVSLTLCVRLVVRSWRMEARRCRIRDQISGRAVCLRRLMKVLWILMLVFHVMVCHRCVVMRRQRVSVEHQMLFSKMVPLGWLDRTMFLKGMCRGSMGSFVCHYYHLWRLEDRTIGGWLTQVPASRFCLNLHWKMVHFRLFQKKLWRMVHGFLLRMGPKYPWRRKSWFRPTLVWLIMLEKRWKERSSCRHW